jgi:hypothetical protein
MTQRKKWRLPALLVLALCGGSARADEAYFLMVFGSQRPVNLPRHAHCFATFVRVSCPRGGSPARQQVQSWTISWMPRTLEIGIYRLRPEAGVNLDLHSTLRWALADRQRVFLWGPYQITRDLFDRAIRQIVHLRSGAVCYKAVVTGYPSDRVSNCIFAVRDLAMAPPRVRVGEPRWGEGAGSGIACALRPWIIDPARTHDWIAGEVGLWRYPLVRRDLDAKPVLTALPRARSLSES